MTTFRVILKLRGHEDYTPWGQIEAVELSIKAKDVKAVKDIVGITANKLANLHQKVVKFTVDGEGVAYRVMPQIGA